ncbi:NTP transferase domain-containing protein [Candidatus Uabimicrobium sp. HlEnr_7]|uniref:phosphocholine cytidylyltransferase family protein n=1 Tax=Candidatus Uabimicrobium helgolandensis TaxID=3095367 RepID=UPI0035566637
MKALILAAGRGSRLKEYTKDKPKSLLEINKTTLIERSLNNLKKVGFSEVVVVTGYLNTLLEDFITNKFSDFCTIVHNIDYTRGSGSSFICSTPHLEGEMVIIESDLLYDYRILERLIAQKEKNAMTLGCFDHGREEVKIIVEQGKISKAFWGDAETKADGDWVGFTKLSSATTKELRKNLENTDPDQGKEINYEDFLFALMTEHPFYPVNVNDLPWLEVDNEQDYLSAAKVAEKIDENL